MIKLGYIAIGILQAALITCPGILRKHSWQEIDFYGSRPPSVPLQLSGYALLFWLFTIVLCAFLAIRD